MSITDFINIDLFRKMGKITYTSLPHVAGELIVVFDGYPPKTFENRCCIGNIPTKNCSAAWISKLILIVDSVHIVSLIQFSVSNDFQK